MLSIFHLISGCQSFGFSCHITFVSDDNNQTQGMFLGFVFSDHTIFHTLFVCPRNKQSNNGHRFHIQDSRPLLARFLILQALETVQLQIGVSFLLTAVSNWHAPHCPCDQAWQPLRFSVFGMYFCHQQKTSHFWTVRFILDEHSACRYHLRETHVLPVLSIQGLIWTGICGCNARHERSETSIAVNRLLARTEFCDKP